MNIENLIRGEVTQEEFLNYYNATIVYRHLIEEVYGYVFNHRGINVIIINEKISRKKKKSTILHELAHIELNQLNQVDNDLLEFHRQDYEDEADRYIESILNELK